MVLHPIAVARVALGPNVIAIFTGAVMLSTYMVTTSVTRVSTYEKRDFALASAHDVPVQYIKLAT